ncbi:MAG: 6-phosphogluconolactonase [Rhizobiaceae bacterium]
MVCRAEWFEFAAPSLLAAALAEAVASRLREAIETRGEVVLAVSGGSTPATFFRALARKHLDWQSVTVTLVDERFVPPSSDRSNERLVRQNFLMADAGAAKFVGLFDDGGFDGAAERASERISNLPQPVDVVILGMGTDGHTASFFADAGNLEALLDPNENRAVLAVRSATAGEPRLTLSSSILTSARHLFVHIEGEEKRSLLSDVLAERTTAPIGSVLNNLNYPADIYWAPGEDK